MKAISALLCLLSISWTSPVFASQTKTSHECVRHMTCQFTAASQFVGIYESNEDKDLAIYNSIADIVTLKVFVEQADGSLRILHEQFQNTSGGVGDMKEFVSSKRSAAAEAMRQCSAEKEKLESQSRLCADYQD